MRPSHLEGRFIFLWVKPRGEMGGEMGGGGGGMGGEMGERDGGKG